MAKNDPTHFVIDTNLLLSGALIQGSVIDIALRTLEEESILVFSDETFAELETVLQRDKFNRYSPLEKRQEYLARYKENSLFVTPDKHFSLCRDQRDNKFLDAAVAGDVEALITGDKDLLVLKTIKGIPIVRMSDFLDQFVE